MVYYVTVILISFLGQSLCTYSNDKNNKHPMDEVSNVKHDTLSRGSEKVQDFGSIMQNRTFRPTLNITRYIFVDISVLH